MKKLVIACSLLIYPLPPIAAPCKPAKLNGTWEIITAPKEPARAQANIVFSAVDGLIQIQDGRVDSGSAIQIIKQGETLTSLAISISGGFISRSTATCRITGLATTDDTGTNNLSFTADWSPLAKALVGRSRNPTTGVTSAFIMRRP